MERYRLSLGLTLHIRRAITGHVWNIRDGNFAIVPVVDHQGVATLHGIVFRLDRVKGLAVDPHMRVEIAYPRDEKDIVTYGLKTRPTLQERSLPIRTFSFLGTLKTYSTPEPACRGRLARDGWMAGDPRSCYDTLHGTDRYSNLRRGFPEPGP